MKTSWLLSILILGFAGGVTLAAPSTNGLDVLVLTDPGNKVVFKGKTDARGSFNTGKLEAGNYVVQFNATNAKGLTGNLFSIAAVGGKRAVTATAVAGEKFSGGGVAMRVQVAGGSRLAGQVAVGDLAAVENVRAAAEIPRAKARSSEFLGRNQDLSGQGAAPAGGDIRPGRP